MTKPFLPSESSAPSLRTVVESDVAQLREILQQQSTNYKLSRMMCMEMIKLIQSIDNYLDDYASGIFFSHVAFTISNKKEVEHGDYSVLASHAEVILRQYEKEVTKK